MNRRNFITLGSAGLLSLETFLKANEFNNKEGKAKSVINIYLPGGMAHHESWDPKYLAPAEYRGPLGTVNTNVPGERFSETLKHTAKVADKLAVIRSMTHGEAAHERGTHNMMTGYKPSPALTYPSIGSVVSEQFGIRKNLPPYIAIPTQSRYGGSGYLNSKHSPFSIGSNPESSNFKVRDISLPDGLSPERFESRKSMRAAVDEHFSKVEEKNSRLLAVESFYSSAYEMISSPEARAAFELDKENQKLRDEYGMNSAGQRFLLARRLIEAGVRFVSTTYGGWDHHSNIRDNMTRQLAPFDQAYARLINDLDERGLLESTLVLVTTEFGRTPKINANAGRDHWPRVFSISMAGGGIKGGSFYGKSDPTGSEPEDDPFTVNNYAATVYHLLGIDPRTELMSPGSRPIRVVDSPDIVKEILA